MQEFPLNSLEKLTEYSNDGDALKVCMHILIIPSWYPCNARDIGGSFFREQAIALRKYGCKVGVIYPELRSLRNWRSIFSDDNIISVETDEGVETYRSRGMNWFPRTIALASKLFVWHGCRLYDRYVAENGVPDIVHVHSLLYAGSVATRICRKYAVPFVVTEHSSAFGNNLVSIKELMIAKQASSTASRKFAVSNEFAILLNNLLCSGNASWDEMPNIVSQQFLNYELPLTRNNNCFNFINIGLMNENKKQANILHAFSETCKRYPDARLTLGGDGPERPQLQQLTNDLGITGKVKFTGLLSREQVLSEVANADVFVLSSRYETFGVVVIEALALGKPVIATRCGGPESILRKEDGILIPLNDINALAVAMRQLLENRTDYDSAEIREACRERYSEATVATRLKQVYAEVVNKTINHPQGRQLAVAPSVNP